MTLEDITLGAFALCNSLRIVAYIPQVRKAAADKHGASAISSTTWSLFLVAHLSTLAYALVNRHDWGLAACFTGNALGCLAIIGITCCKRRRHAAQLGHAATGKSAASCSPARARMRAIGAAFRRRRAAQALYAELSGLHDADLRRFGRARTGLRGRATELVSADHA
jgi:hypothetical protein